MTRAERRHQAERVKDRVRRRFAWRNASRHYCRAEWYSDPRNVGVWAQSHRPVRCQCSACTETRERLARIRSNPPMGDG